MYQLGTRQMSKEKYSTLDLIVIFVFALLFFQVVVYMLWFDPEAALEFREQRAIIYYIDAAKPLFAIYAISSLLTWMIFGGSESHLWKWLPPFCFFFWCNRWQKWMLVSLIILGTLVGIIASALGPF
jgi:hypothetical protein